MDKTMTLKPKLSEKSYGLSEKLNTYVFIVPSSANKLSIADAVASQFKVTVTNVNVANSIGKKKRTSIKRSRPIMGQRARTRKAYVTLKEGDSLPIFAALQDDGASEKPEKAVKTEKTKAKKGDK